MAQTPKDHVREAFVAAAGAALAERGFPATTMAAVAERAGSSVGNLYKYFPSKEALLRAVVPPELVGELEKRTRARIRALGTAKDVRELGAGARYHAIAGELLDYCFQHRAAVVIVLARAEGTPYSAFAGRFVEQLVRWSLDYARAAYPALLPTAELRWVLGKAYTSFISHVADALHRFPSEARARAAIALVTAQHQGGLKHLFETAGAAHAEPSHAQTPPFPDEAAGPGAGGTGACPASSVPTRRRPRPARGPGRARRRG